MPEPFDPYSEWLGIAPEEQPPDHYRLLGIEPFGPDPDVISFVADELEARLGSLLDGEYPDLAQQLLDEIAAARDCLLDPEAKAENDDWLAAAWECEAEAETEDWDDKIAAMVSLHESLQSRLIESEPSIPGPPPPAEDDQADGAAMPTEDAVAPILLDEVSESVVCVLLDEAPEAPSRAQNDPLSNQQTVAESATPHEKRGKRLVLTARVCACCVLVGLALGSMWAAQEDMRAASKPWDHFCPPRRGRPPDIAPSAAKSLPTAP